MSESDGQYVTPNKFANVIRERIEANITTSGLMVALEEDCEILRLTLLNSRDEGDELIEKLTEILLQLVIPDATDHPALMRFVFNFQNLQKIIVELQSR